MNENWWIRSFFLLAIVLPTASAVQLNTVEIICDHHTGICAGAECTSYTLEMCSWYACLHGLTLVEGYQYITGQPPSPSQALGWLNFLSYGCSHA